MRQEFISDLAYQLALTVTGQPTFLAVTVESLADMAKADRAAVVIEAVRMIALWAC